MSRVKGGLTSAKRRRNILSQVKGYRFARSKKERAAREAIVHAGKYAFAHRRDKKNDFRRLWNVHLNAGLRAIDEKLTYSRFVGSLNKQGVKLNRKMLSTLVVEYPGAFKRVVEKIAR